jgi:hypothetical protein
VVTSGGSFNVRTIAGICSVVEQCLKIVFAIDCKLRIILSYIHFTCCVTLQHTIERDCVRVTLYCKSYPLGVGVDEWIRCPGLAA